MADLVLKNADLWNALVSGSPDVPAPLVRLSKAEMPAIAAYAITKALRKATEEYADLDKARIALVEKYSAKLEDGSPAPSPDGNGVILADPQGFHTDFAALLDQPVTLSGCRAVTVTELGGAVVSPEVLLALEAFVIDA